MLMLWGKKTGARGTGGVDEECAEMEDQKKSLTINRHRGDGGY